jgi:hypothetical protein
MAQTSITTPPGDDTAWFWSADCASRCDRAIVSFDLSYAFGRPGDRPYTLGAGLSGILVPYVEGYLQAGQSPHRPYGVGARLGIPVLGWSNHQVYGRYDVPFGDRGRLLLNPGLFLHTGSSPNDETSGSFLAFVQGIGIQFEGESVVMAPAFTVGFGGGKRESSGQQIGPFTTVFGTASLNITFRRSRGS